MRKILKGDEVVVISGRNKGSRGTVRKYIPETERVVVEGVNMIKKHIRPGRGRQSGIVEVEAPLHVSNVMVIDPGSGEPTRVGIRRDAEGKNERFSKKSNAALPGSSK